MIMIPGSYRGEVKITCGPIQHSSNPSSHGNSVPPQQPGRPRYPQSSEEEEDIDNLILIDDTDEYPRKTSPVDRNKPTRDPNLRDHDPRNQNRYEHNQRDQNLRNQFNQPTRQSPPRSPADDKREHEHYERNNRNNQYPPRPDQKEGSNVHIPRGDGPDYRGESNDITQNHDEKMLKPMDDTAEENEVQKNEFDTYEFNETQENYVRYGMDTGKWYTIDLISLKRFICLVVVHNNRVNYTQTVKMFILVKFSTLQ